MTQQLFEKFHENISLTKEQRKDAITKYREVCKTLHSKYYDQEDYKNTRFLFGSYKKKTAIRPMTEDQDIDVLFKMPPEKFDEYDDNTSNPQSQLLQDIRNILKEKYSTSEKVKAWGKVILVKTSDGKHNIELLPAWEEENGSFKIPNSENSGSWENFDPRKEIDLFKESNKKTNGLTRTLSKMIKKWAREVDSLTIKSYEIENFVIKFLEEQYEDYTDLFFSNLIRDFFSFLYDEIGNDNKSYVKTARDRSEKAIFYEQNEEYEKANDEWKKIFGKEFPSISGTYRNISGESHPNSEEFIENIVRVEINNQYILQIDADIEQNGFRKKNLSEYIREKLPLQKRKKIVFKIIQTNVPEPFNVKWKVRNFGVEAEIKGDLRGEISADQGFHKKEEHTAYKGEHFVECYIIKEGICVARRKIDVPIGSY